MKNGDKWLVCLNYFIFLKINKRTVHKIRPAKWYGKSSKFSIFENKEDFLSAMEETVYKNKDTRDDGPEWLSTVIDNYEKHYGVKLSIPRWSDVMDKYIND
jgi:hypothetical protein